jgi:hypothetical protein
MKNGNIKTEVIRTEKHEIFDDKAAPDDDGSSARLVPFLTPTIIFGNVIIDTRISTKKI